MVTLYHHTTPESAEAILGGGFKSGPQLRRDHAFFTTHPHDPELIGGWNPDLGPNRYTEILQATVPRRSLRPDDIQPKSKDIRWYKVPHKVLKSTQLSRYQEPRQKQAGPRATKSTAPKSDSPWMDKHGFTQDVLNRNALAWWDTMTPQQQHEAKFWYPAFHDWASEMASRQGLHPHKGPGVVAATSPLRRWDGNLQDAHGILTHYPEHPERIKKPPGLGSVGNVERAKRVIDAPDDPAAIRAALSASADPESAKKILNFHDLGVNPEHGGAHNWERQPVVIDSWMPRGILVHPKQLSAAKGDQDINLVPETLRGRKVKKVRKKNPATGVWEDQGHRDPNLRDVGLWALGNKGGYDRMANALRHVAKQRGLPFAHTAQAGVWNQLGGTANPAVDGDGVADHDQGPLTHITDPNALYDEVWKRQLRGHPMAQPAAPKAASVGDREHNHVDDDWDHLHTPMSPEELAVHHGETPPLDRPDPNTASEEELQADPNGHKFFQQWFDYCNERNNQIDKGARRTAAEEPPALEQFGKIQDGNGRWHFPHKGSYEMNYGSGEMHRWHIAPADAPATYRGTYYEEPREVHYDPARVHVSDGEFRPQVTPNDPNAITDYRNIPAPEGRLWRGMSHEEYDQAKQRGYFESNHSFNIGTGDGDYQADKTFFSTDPTQAANYATGFAPWQYQPTFTRPAHMVGIPGQPHLPRGAMGEDPKSTEVGVPGRIPFNSVTDHWVGNAAAIHPGEIKNDRSHDRWGIPTRGLSPRTEVHWEPGETGGKVAIGSLVYAQRSFTPDELAHHYERGWRDEPCQDPDHHGEIGGRCAECGSRVAPEPPSVQRAASRRSQRMLSVTDTLLSRLESI